MITFELPKELIAQRPANPRDSARLLIYDRKDRSIKDSIFSDLEIHLSQDTTLVLNNSKVENCRLLFPISKLEVFVLNKLDTNTVLAMVQPGRKFKLGQVVELAEGIKATVKEIDDNGYRTLVLNVSHDDQRLKAFDHVPLPPYIAQNDSLASGYQTVYADPLGSKAAPTAGLHFTANLLEQIKKTHTISKVTLHVGLGTFASPTDEQIKSKHLHPEHYSISDDNLKLILKSDHRTAVGTTSARTLESFAQTGENEGSTDIFIQPGYKFKLTDSLITNFHLPGTSLLMLVESMVGSEDELKRVYDHAILNEYRFYSFGDAMLIK